MNMTYGLEIRLMFTVFFYLIFLSSIVNGEPEFVIALTAVFGTFCIGLGACGSKNKVFMSMFSVCLSFAAAIAALGITRPVMHSGYIMTLSCLAYIACIAALMWIETEKYKAWTGNGMSLREMILFGCYYSIPPISLGIYLWVFTTGWVLAPVIGILLTWLIAISLRSSTEPIPEPQKEKEAT